MPTQRRTDDVEQRKRRPSAARPPRRCRGWRSGTEPGPRRRRRCRRADSAESRFSETSQSASTTQTPVPTGRRAGARTPSRGHIPCPGACGSSLPDLGAGGARDHGRLIGAVVGHDHDATLRRRGSGSPGSSAACRRSAPPRRGPGPQPRGAGRRSPAGARVADHDRRTEQREQMGARRRRRRGHGRRVHGPAPEQSSSVPPVHRHPAPLRGRAQHFRQAWSDHGLVVVGENRRAGRRSELVAPRATASARASARRPGSPTGTSSPVRPSLDDLGDRGDVAPDDRRRRSSSPRAAPSAGPRTRTAARPRSRSGRARGASCCRRRSRDTPRDRDPELDRRAARASPRSGPLPAICRRQHRRGARKRADHVRHPLLGLVKPADEQDHGVRLRASLRGRDRRSRCRPRWGSAGHRRRSGRSSRPRVRSGRPRRRSA